MLQKHQNISIQVNEVNHMKDSMLQGIAIILPVICIMGKAKHSFNPNINSNFPATWY